MKSKSCAPGCIAKHDQSELDISGGFCFTFGLPELPARATLNIGRRDTRWDVYPQREPPQVIAFNWEGFWALAENADGSLFWYRTPTSYSISEASVTDRRAFEVLCTAKEPT